MKYRKKPVVIEAFRLGHDFYPEWFEAAIQDGIASVADDTATVKTLEGDHTTSFGDWVIQGVKGEIYFCRNDIFRMTYENDND